MDNYTNYKNLLTLKLPLGFSYNGEYLKEVELLKSNGVAEKVFSDRSGDKAYSWMGKIISVAVKSIGSIQVGVAARAEYMKSETVTIPQVVLSMSFADVNSLIVEIHRRVWKNLIPRQESLCKYCAKPMLVDIDLNEIKFPNDMLQVLSEREVWEELICDLPDGFTYTAPPVTPGSNVAHHKELDGMTFNRFVFRVPTLADVIRHENISDNGILFWRKIAYDCLNKIQMVDTKGKVDQDLPVEVKFMYGQKLFNELLTVDDLMKIRSTLRDLLPALPFFYETDCICPKKMKVPVTVEASGFFSA